MVEQFSVGICCRFLVSSAIVVSSCLDLRCIGLATVSWESSKRELWVKSVHKWGVRVLCRKADRKERETLNRPIEPTLCLPYSLFQSWSSSTSARRPWLSPTSTTSWKRPRKPSDFEASIARMTRITKERFGAFFRCLLESYCFERQLKFIRANPSWLIFSYSKKIGYLESCYWSKSIQVKLWSEFVQY